MSLPSTAGRQPSASPRSTVGGQPSASQPSTAGGAAHARQAVPDAQPFDGGPSQAGNDEEVQRRRTAAGSTVPSAAGAAVGEMPPTPTATPTESNMCTILPVDSDISTIQGRQFPRPDAPSAGTTAVALGTPPRWRAGQGGECSRTRLIILFRACWVAVACWVSDRRGRYGEQPGLLRVVHRCGPVVGGVDRLDAGGRRLPGGDPGVGFHGRGGLRRGDAPGGADGAADGGGALGGLSGLGVRDRAVAGRLAGGSARPGPEAAGLPSRGL